MRACESHQVVVVRVTCDGWHRFCEEKTEEGFTRIERSFGSFERSLRLPSAIDAEAIEAKHDNGVLTISIPKATEARAHRVKVLPA